VGETRGVAAVGGLDDVRTGLLGEAGGVAQILGVVFRIVAFEMLAAGVGHRQDRDAETVGLVGHFRQIG